MLIDLLSTNNYVSFNIKLAHIIGLRQAIYVSELMNINDKAIRKKKVENKEDGEYFTLDREYFANRTTFEFKEQLEIENNLLKIKLIRKDSNEPNVIFLDLSVLTSIMTNSDEKITTDLGNLIKKKRKGTNKELKRSELISNLSVNNEELRNAYISWIDSCISSSGTGRDLSVAGVISAQKVVDDISNHNLDTALRIIEIAAVNCYKNMEWAVTEYEKSCRKKFLYQKQNIDYNKKDDVGLGGGV